jgi:hypothetical protein
VGSRGRNAAGFRRGVPKNRLRPSAYRTEVEEFNWAYYDLILGASGSRGRYWEDPYCDERREAWQAWRDRIRSTFPFAWSNGDRPDGWVDFELPQLMMEAIDAGRFTEAEIKSWPSLTETVYHLDADGLERQRIEDGWRHDIQLFGAKKAAEDYDVPRWFLDRECPAAVATLRRRKRA